MTQFSKPKAAPFDPTAALMEAQRELEHGKSPDAFKVELEDRGVSPAEAEVAVSGGEEFNARSAVAFQAANEPFESCDDLGNGKRMAKRHAHEIRYIAESRSWLAWNGSLWVPGAIGAVERHAKDTANSIFIDAYRAGKIDGNKAKKLAAWASASSSRTRCEAMMWAARSNEKIEATWEDFDSDPWALNVANGTVDLTDGTLRPHDPAEMHSKMTGAALGEEPAPSWGGFLEEVLPDDDVRHYVHKLAGYSITGEVGEHVLPFAHGGGANGKSVFLAVIRRVLGDYAAEAAPDLLVARRERGIPVDIIDLRGFRFVTTSEVEGGRKMATDVMKRITGDSDLKARKMRQNFESFRNVTHLWLAANERPQVDGLDEAIWRRIRMLPFTVTIPADQRDPRLIEKLLHERDGILGWLVDGCLAYQREGLTPPDGVAAATDEYRADSNPLLAWADERCTLDPAAFTASEALHEDYAKWCGEDRYRGKPLSKRSPKFSAGLVSLGCQNGKEGSGNAGTRVRGWHGIGLNDVSGALGV
jgi:putative DNA primase/helicase